MKNMKRVKAEISWVPKNEGGRDSPPLGPRYITVARFEEEKEKYPKEAWSLVVEFSRMASESHELIADVSFLMDDAPDYLLHPGSKFDLFEGRKLVAKGEVI